MKRILLTLSACLFLLNLHSQKIALKTNIPYWATGTINLGGEIYLSKKNTLDFTWGYNPWTWNDNKKWKHWLIMPEFRHYLRESFNGHFFGLHAGYTEYNIGGIPLLYYKDAKYYRYEGWAIGSGISYGYQWRLSNRWNLEATAGVGVFYTEYGKYIQNKCGAHIGDFNNLYVAPTKFGINFIYFLR